MKDTVILLINDYKVFVGDFYQDKIKQVKFRTQDYWEVFDTSDLKEFLEYMIYPLGYKKFKDSHLRIYFNKPLTYNYVYEVKEELSLCESLAVDNLQELIIEASKAHEEYQDGMVFECLEKRYRIKPDQTLEEVEGDKAELQVSLEYLCQYIIDQGIEGQCVENALSHYIWFSPATFVEQIGVKEKYKYLEVENQCIEMIEDGYSVHQDEVMITYEQSIYKLFGKKEVKRREQRAPQAGNFVSVTPLNEMILIKKDQILGIIAPSWEEKKDAIKWFRKIIKY